MTTDTIMPITALRSSFRDPDGFLFHQNGRLLRQVNPSYLPHLTHLKTSGLLDTLWQKRLLIAHEEIGAADEQNGVQIEPLRIPYVSYPYEWCFSQLKDAAVLTLDIQRIAIEHDMSLKDASAYNVQFVGGRPVFIDTLSFEKYEEGQPWQAYRQFCQHFLAPLALMAKVDVRLRHLLRAHIDGVPLDLASNLLPRRTRLSYSLLSHIHLHARAQRSHANDAATGGAAATRKFTRTMMIGIIESLRSAVEKLAVKEHETEWGTYYSDTNYTDDAMLQKEHLVGRFVEAYFEPDTIVHDIGANTGRFSRLAASDDRPVVAHDIDEMAVEMHYRHVAESGQNILPLLLDLTNPSPDLGWAQEERDGLTKRIQDGQVMALALIHHIAISNNVPLPRVAEFLAAIANTLIIEFVPKEDSQVERLLATRKDIFPDYTFEGFERAFKERFDVLEKHAIDGTSRVLYAMRKRA